MSQTPIKPLAIDEVKSRIREYAESIAVSYSEQYFHVIEQTGKECESPIEVILFAELMYNQFLFVTPYEDYNYIMFFRNKKIPQPPHFLPMIVGALQYDVGPYRVDFYLEGYDRNSELTFKLAIECDGHEFHEKTKAQARRDKQRDRWLQTNGIAVLRFTGSEIWADAEKCVDQIHDFIASRVLGL